MAQMGQKTVSKRMRMPLRGIELYTRVEGQGSPIVFMHGGPGIDHSTLLPLRQLCATNTVIFYDHRCNGRSLGPDVTSMTWDNLAADADALREALGLETWTVFGHSFGGMVALEYALRYPHRTSHLILADTCADIACLHRSVPKILTDWGYSKRAIEQARRFFTGQIKAHELIPSMMQFGTAYTYSFNLWHSLQLLGIKTNAQAVIFGFGTLMKAWSVMDKLPTLSMPTLIMAGQHDFEFPPEHQMEMAALIPNVTIKIIERAGHNAPMEHPQQTLALIKQFMST